MLFRPAAEMELSDVMGIIEDGRAALRRLDIDQWQGGNPSEDLIRADIAAGRTMVAAQDGALLGTLAFFDTIEPDYARIIAGRWLSDEPTARIATPSSIMDRGAETDLPGDSADGMMATTTSEPCTYATLHRVAVAAGAARRGVGTFMIQSSITLATMMGLQSVRADTHEGNIPMQRMLEHCGLSHCCDIAITLSTEPTPRRLGYEIILP